MLVYSGIKTDFMRDVDEDTLAPKIKQTILDKMGRNTPDAFEQGFLSLDE